MYIQEHAWGKLKHETTDREIHEVPEELTKIRMNSKLQTLMREHPYAQAWIPGPYTPEEIASALKTQKIIGRRVRTDYLRRPTKLYGGA